MYLDKQLDKHLDKQPTKEVAVARVFNSKCKPTVCQKGNRTANGWKRVFKYNINLCSHVKDSLYNMHLYICKYTSA